MRQREIKRIDRKARNGRADRRKKGTIVDGGKMGRHDINSSSRTIRVGERSGRGVATFKILDLGRRLREVRLQKGTESTPGSTLGTGNLKTKGRLGKFVLIVPMYFFNTNRGTPTTVTLVAVIRSSLEGGVPETFPVGGARRAGRDGLVKRGIYTVIELVNKNINRRGGNRGRGDIGGETGHKGCGQGDKSRDIKGSGFFFLEAR